MSRRLLNRGRYRKFIHGPPIEPFIKFVLSDFCSIFVLPKNIPKGSNDLYVLHCLSFFKISRAKVIKQGEAGEDPEGRVGGLWCSLVASGLTTGRGQVGSQP